MPSCNKRPGKCHGCGDRVTFCTAVNYEALEMGEDNLPRYKSVEKCINCSLCYRIRPAAGNGKEEGWINSGFILARKGPGRKFVMKFDNYQALCKKFCREPRAYPAKGISSKPTTALPQIRPPAACAERRKKPTRPRSVLSWRPPHLCSPAPDSARPRLESLPVKTVTNSYRLHLELLWMAWYRRSTRA